MWNRGIKYYTGVTFDAPFCVSHSFYYQLLAMREGIAVSLVIKPHSHCAGVATVHPDAGQPVYRDAPGHIS